MRSVRLMSLLMCGSVVLLGCDGKSSISLTSPEGRTAQLTQPALQAGTPVNPVASSPKSDSATQTAFTVAVLPDTQRYAQKNPMLFHSQTQWIADHYREQNIKFTIHVGDVVETPNSDKEWKIASAAMARLDKNPETPYSILAGNHDILGLGLGGLDQLGGSTMAANEFDNKRNLKRERFLTYFPAKRQREYIKTFKATDSLGLNSYHIFTDNDGQQYLVFALDWRVSQQTIDWAKSVLKSHPTLPAILSSHEILDPRKDGNLPKITVHGQWLLDQLIDQEDQIFLTFNGHWNGEGYRVHKNGCGRNVLMIVVNYQNEYNGGNGLLQLVTFNKPFSRFDIRSYSPYVAQKPENERTSDDVEERWSFSIPIDFDARLSNFTSCAID